jgi:hypothetical protein
MATGLLFGMSASLPHNGYAFTERMGMIESTDHGVTWRFKGHADFHARDLNPVDPSVLFDNGLLAFYFFDLMSLTTDTAVVYRSVAVDNGGLDFSPPVPAFKFPGFLTDPAVVKLTDSKYRMYVHTQSGILSATSKDGFIFTLDPGTRTAAGGVPGAVVLPDSKVRLFVCGQGITSLISDNGLDFTQESGVRIAIFSGAGIIADPDPRRCQDGNYRMAYKVRPAGQGESPVLDEVHLAESMDGFTWTPGSASLVTGSVPTLVEMPDGRLRIYYVDFQQDKTAGLFKLVKTVQVTPDSRFLTGSFTRINYVPATNHFVVTFGTKASTHKGDMKGSGYAYKEYTTGLQPTGKADTLLWNPLGSEAGDSGSTMVGNDYFLVTVPQVPGYPYGWRLMKFDAVNWTKKAEKTVPLKSPNEADLDPSVAYLNGQLDVSDQYNPNGKWQDGVASHHHFFSTGLDSLGIMVLSDSPHISGVSMIFADGVYHIISADSYPGDLVVIRYDKNWKYLGVKNLIIQAHWSQGVVFDGRRFYVSYLNTSQRNPQKFFPVHYNVHLAAFDRDWNLLEDAALTNFVPSDKKQPGRPWVILHKNCLYVSFDCDSVDTATGEEMLAWQAFVKVYELTQSSTSTDGGSGGPIGPSGYSLYQNYPNPFNPSTSIAYALLHGRRVRITVFDLQGRQVKTLVDGMQPAGRFKAYWNGIDEQGSPLSDWSSHVPRSYLRDCGRVLFSACFIGGRAINRLTGSVFYALSRAFSFLFPAFSDPRFPSNSDPIRFPSWACCSSCSPWPVIRFLVISSATIIRPSSRRVWCPAPSTCLP